MDVAGRLWPRPELRTSDADRQGVVVELQRHFVDGRLTSDELAERVAQALNARTFGELAIPLGDLPVLPSEVEQQQLATTSDEDAAYADAPYAGFGPPLGALLVVIGVLAMMWLLVLPAHHFGMMSFWPVFVMGFFFLGRPRRRLGRRDRWHRGGPPTRYL